MSRQLFHLTFAMRMVAVSLLLSSMGCRTKVQEDSQSPPNAPTVATEDATERVSSPTATVASGVETKTFDNAAFVVTDVDEKTIAGRAGLMKGDRIVAIDGRLPKDRQDTQTLLQQSATKSYHVLTVDRDGKEIEIVTGRYIEFFGALIGPDEGSRALIRRSDRKLPAGEAGIVAGDVVVGVSGRKIDTFDQFAEFAIPLVRKMSPGQEINMRILRDAEEVQVTVIRPETELPLIPAPSQPAPDPATVEKQTRTSETSPTVPTESLTPNVSRVVAVLHSPGAAAPTTVVVPQPAAKIVPAVPGTSSTSQGNIALSLPTVTLNVLNRIGLVLISKDAQSAILQARIVGLPQGPYQLVLHEIGDLSDINGTTAGRVVTILSTFQVGVDGTADIQQSLDQPTRALNLVGHAISVISDPSTAKLNARTGNAPIANGVFGIGTMQHPPVP